LDGDFDALTNTVFCGDIWEMDLAMPYALGAKVIFWIGLLRSTLALTKGRRWQHTETVARRVLISPACFIGFDRMKGLSAAVRAHAGRLSRQAFGCTTRHSLQRCGSV